MGVYMVMGSVCLGMGSDNVFSPDGSIRRMSSVGRSPSAAANNYVRTTAAAATTPAGIDPNASLNTTSTLHFLTVNLIIFV